MPRLSRRLLSRRKLVEACLVTFIACDRWGVVGGARVSTEIESRGFSASARDDPSDDPASLDRAPPVSGQGYHEFNRPPAKPAKGKSKGKARGTGQPVKRAANKPVTKEKGKPKETKGKGKGSPKRQPLARGSVVQDMQEKKTKDEVRMRNSATEKLRLDGREHDERRVPSEQRGSGMRASSTRLETVRSETRPNAPWKAEQRVEELVRKVTERTELTAENSNALDEDASKFKLPDIIGERPGRLSIFGLVRKEPCEKRSYTLEEVAEKAGEWCNKARLPKDQQVPKKLEGLFWYKGYNGAGLALCMSLGRWNAAKLQVTFPCYSGIMWKNVPIGIYLQNNLKGRDYIMTFDSPKLDFARIASTGSPKEQSGTSQTYVQSELFSSMMYFEMKELPSDSPGDKWDRISYRGQKAGKTDDAEKKKKYIIDYARYELWRITDGRGKKVKKNVEAMLEKHNGDAKLAHGTSLYVCNYDR